MIEKSAGAVIFYKGEGEESKLSSSPSAFAREGKIYYLLLHYQSGARRPHPYWDFPKGHIEEGEKLEETVKREVEEETGIKDITIIEGFKETIKYFFRFERKNILKFVTFFLTETKEKQVRISQEHIGFKWLPYKEALEQLKFKNAKGILKKANEFLSSSFDYE